MADLSTHYKEINPVQTVQNVKNFFNSYGLTLKEIEAEQSEAGTWYCHVDVYIEDTKLEGANGKGVSLEYALASGYAELYERFCNGMAFLGNPWWNMAVMKKNHETHGYYFRPDEKIMTYNEIIQGTYRLKDFFTYFCHTYEDLQVATLDYITGGKCIGLPMNNICSSKPPIYMDPRVLLRVTNSIGMAAGNTLDEALNQGIAELLEKYAQDQLFNNWNVPHYAIKLENIENEKLQEIIHTIESLNYKLYLFDLSYNFEVPTMMSLLMDTDHNVLNINFGSFPVFDIAAERVLTELYQGVSSYRDSDHLLRLQIPFKSLSTQQVNSIYCNSISGEIFPEDFFKNIEYKDTYNHDVFIDKKTTNAEIKQYYIQLAEKMHIEFYYLDNSLSKDIYAVHILCEGEKAYTGNNLYNITWDKISVNRAKRCLKQLTEVYNGIYNNNLKYPILLDTMQLTNDPNIISFIGKIRMWNDFLISENNGQGFDNLLCLLSSDNQGVTMMMNQNSIPFDILSSFLYIPFKKYLQLRSYVSLRSYSDEEILNIFNNFFNYNITQKDIDKCSNNSYVLENAYLKPMYNYLHSDQYNKIISMFTK